jgi:glycosyltransferase involved in cell wall biosynthesis
MSESIAKKMTVLQVLPALESGGVERGTLEVGKFLTSQGHRSIVISAGGRLVDQLLREGSEHFNWPIGKKSLLTLLLIPKLINFINYHNIDIVHVRSRLPAWICYLALKCIPKNKRPSFITTVHGTYSINKYSRIMTMGDQVIVISRKILSYVTNNYKTPEEKLNLNYRGVDQNEFPYGYQPSNEWLENWFKTFPETKSKFLITLPARVTRWKGQEDLILVLAELKNKIPNLHAIVVGEIKSDKLDFYIELKNKSKKLGLQDMITFTSYRSDVKEIMAISNIVLSLSHEPEAFGRTTIEALKLGIPVIGYDHGGVKEQLSEVFPEGKVRARNFHAVARLIYDWHTKMPTVFRTTAFDLDTMLRNTLSVYEKAQKIKTITSSEK